MPEGVFLAGMPPAMDLGNGCTLSFAAIDTTFGDPVSGVTIKQASIWFESAGDAKSFAVGPFMLVPGPGA